LHPLQADATARAAAVKLFKSQLLGRRQGDSLQAALVAAVDKEFKTRSTANIAESNAVCQRVEMSCSRLLDQLAAMAVPSMRRFEQGYADCYKHFQVRLSCKQWMDWVTTGEGQEDL
jgi:hypothetical protein